MDAATSNLVVDTIAGNQKVNIYQLSKILDWSYGKTQQTVDHLIKSGKIHASYQNSRGRRVKLLSTKPIEMTRAPTNEANNEIILAYKHLYGIFKELKGAKIDPTPGLLAYAEKHDMEPKNLVSILDKANTTIQPTSEV